MKNLNTILNPRNVLRLTLLAVALCSMSAMFLAYAAPTQTVTLTVVNNSAKDLRYLYLSPTGNDNWSSDQLNDAGISAGGSRTINFNWEQSSVKLVGEDRDGCFLTTTVTVASSIEWTITNDTPRNCGDWNQ